VTSTASFIQLQNSKKLFSAGGKTNAGGTIGRRHSIEFFAAVGWAFPAVEDRAWGRQGGRKKGQEKWGVGRNKRGNAASILERMDYPGRSFPILSKAHEHKKSVEEGQFLHEALSPVSLEKNT